MAIRGARRVTGALKTLGASIRRPSLLAGHKIKGLMGDDELLALLTMASRVRSGSTILEIGVYLGKSTFYVEAGAQGQSIRHIVVDTFETGVAGGASEKRREDFDANISRFREDVEVWEMDSSGLGAKLEAEGVCLDMAFIDGDHSYEMVKSDLEAVLSHSTPGAVICLHDFLTPCGVTRAAGEYLETKAIEPVRLVESLLIARKT